MKIFSPKGTVIQVSLYNKNVNQGAPTGSGLAYITPNGNIWLDGHTYSVGESAYLYNDTFYQAPPSELIKMVEKYMEDHIAMLIRESEKIDRNAIISECFDEIFGFKYKDYSARYRNLSGQDYNQRDIGTKIDEITTKHDPDAIRKAIIARKLDAYRFEIGGILHLPDEAALTPIQVQAVLSYQNQGGRLGKSALNGLGLSYEGLS